MHILLKQNKQKAFINFIFIFSDINIDEFYLFLGPYIFCSVGTNNDYYTHYTMFNSQLNSVNVSLKLWNPGSLYNDEVRIALSVLAIPANGSEFLRWDIGFEIFLSNNKTGVIVNPPEVMRIITYLMIILKRVFKDPRLLKLTF